MSKHDQRDLDELDVTIRQIDALSARINEWSQTSERVLAIGATALGVLGVVAAANQFYWGAIGGPLVLAVLMSYTPVSTAEINGIGGYQAALERHANRLVGREIYQWESRLAKSRFGDLQTNIFRIWAMILSLVVVALALWAACQLETEAMRIGAIVGVLVVSAGAAISIGISAKGSGSKTHEGVRASAWKRLNGDED